ncbi:MAG: PhoX family protein [Gammaproteobacteria bacterium]
MAEKQSTFSSEHDEDAITNTSDNLTFESILEKRFSRRQLLRGTAGAAAMAVLGGVGLGPAWATGRYHRGHGHGARAVKLGFAAVPKSLADIVTVPSGYRHDVLYRLGDPIAPGVAEYANDGTDDPESFAHRAGDHHDGMSYFGLSRNGERDENSSARGLLCVNHEAITPAFLHPTGQTVVDGARTVADEVLREFYAHGVSVIEVVKKRGKKGEWSYKQESRFNHRIHTLTRMKLSGPAAKTPYMITKFSPDGSETRGTVNNCANGATPWGTYLTCEENWAGYFRRIAATDDSKRTAKELASFARYGVVGNGRELWATVTPDTADDFYGRWNAMKLGASADGSDDYRNVANTYGWVVEIDPFNRKSIPKKRTALGRFAHEGAWLGPAKKGEPLVSYMGCDARNEYIYKYVSNRRWDPRDANQGMAAGDKYLDDGKLYVATFNADGTGEWRELSFGINNITPTNQAYAFADQADVVINLRLAADAAGATKMDRPEWAAVHPKNGEVYVTLTNTNASSRPVTSVDAANPRFYNDQKTTGEDQLGNPNGHIIRLAETHGKVDATSFTWDVFLFGARASADATNVNISGLTDANDFSSPDSVWFSRANPGLLWFHTDDGAYTDVTNCMLLAAVPGEGGDGARRTVTNFSGTTIQSVDTYVGKKLGEKRLRRFLVGPKECEITGITETPDGRAIFVNIQHPGETTTPDFATGAFGSHWPDGGLSRPRTATIVITKDDGDKIAV